MQEITSVYGREVLDSRGNPTVEVEVTLAGDIMGRASVPSGASTGSREALELRDQEPARYLGKGVQKAVAHVNDVLGPAIEGYDATEQRAIDYKLIQTDGTETKKNLGANAILGVSMAVARAAAGATGQPLYRYLGGAGTCLTPTPMFNILNGGAHAENNVDIQEFMILPVGVETCAESIRCAAEVFHALNKVLKERGLACGVGDEGGFAPNLESNRAALDLISEAIERAGFKVGEDVVMGLDVAATEFYKDGKYVLEGEGKSLGIEEIVKWYGELVENYPIVTIEDGMSEDDNEGWKALTEAIGHRCQLVGDDLFVTNPEALAHGIENDIANAILIKLNQIGTVSETLDAIYMAQRASYGTIISHRSGETEDTFIADLSVAVGAGQIKTGAPCRGERTAKYNQLIRIEEDLGEIARYAGGAPYGI